MSKLCFHHISKFCVFFFFSRRYLIETSCENLLFSNHLHRASVEGDLGGSSKVGEAEDLNCCW